MKLNVDGFLWPEEEKLFAHVMKLNEATLAFDESERGNFCSDYFSPYIIPVLPHEPWEYHNIPIPPGIHECVIQLLREKITAGLYEPTQSLYHSKWFCIMKKNGKIRIVHDLQPLNKVTIRDAGVPPILDDFVEPFASHQCYTIFDLFSQFDACSLHPDSRDLTSFMTPLSLLCHTTIGHFAILSSSQCSYVHHLCTVSLNSVNYLLHCSQCPQHPECCHLHSSRYLCHLARCSPLPYALNSTGHFRSAFTISNVPSAVVLSTHLPIWALLPLCSLVLNLSLVV